MTEPIYRRIEHGKRVRYELIGNASHWTSNMDVLKPGQFRLEFASRDGMRRYAYPVSPDVAGWEAAALIAQHTMRSEISRAARCVPQTSGMPRPYTKKQAAILARYRQEMADAGAHLPEWWQFTSSYDISKAAIEAVREYKP